MLPPRGPDGHPWPRVTIVTPSYNQGQFLEETIRSVLLQGYPNLEYLVMDGGSRDGTRDLLKKYEPFLDGWVSERDEGQSHAINKGLDRSTGTWTGWQNSDDYYEPGAVQHMIRAALAPDAASISVLYGSLKTVDAQSNVIGDYPTSEFDLQRMLPWANMFNQSMFFHRRVLDAGFRIDPALHHFIDHDLFWRIIWAGHRFQYVPEISACFRLHDLAKGATQHEIAAREIHDLYRRIYLHESMPASIRALALRSMRGNCLNQFGKGRWDLFKRFFADMRRLAGLRATGLNLCLRRLTLGMGCGSLEFIRGLWRGGRRLLG